MTRSKNIFSVRNTNARHFRLVHRPVGEGETLSFDSMFEEYDPYGLKGKLSRRLGQDTALVSVSERYEDDANDNDFNDFDDDEMVDLDDLDAEFDKYAECIDIEGESDTEHVRPVAMNEKVGEAAKYGILFDDRNYDYTKHLRTVGVTPGAVLIDASGAKSSSAVAVAKKPSSKNEDFFGTEVQPEAVEDVNDDDEEATIDPVLIEANRRAREEYRALLEKAAEDPALKEVLEALEDDRYCVEDVDDDLVLSLDQLSRLTIDSGAEEANYGEFDDEEIDILASSEGEAEIDIVGEEEIIDITGEEEDTEEDELEKIMREYDDDDDNDELSEYEGRTGYGGFSANEFDLESFSDIEMQQLDEDEAAEMLQFLRESGRSRKTSLYEKRRRSPNLPPLHIAIAQYDEVRRDLAVNHEFILEKYGSKDEGAVKAEEAREERELEKMFAEYDRKETELKNMNIETAKWHISNSGSSNEGPSVAPQVIVEDSNRGRKQKGERERPNKKTFVEKAEAKEKVKEKVNKGQARAADETPEEKKARKAQIKAEKREKRALKSKK